MKDCADESPVPLRKKLSPKRRRRRKVFCRKAAKQKQGENRWFNSLSPWRAGGLLKILLGMPEKPEGTGSTRANEQLGSLGTMKLPVEFKQNEAFRFQVNYERRIISKQCPEQTE